MGFVHDTGSEIFGMETRSESAYLSDITKKKEHLFIYYQRKAAIRDEIVGKIMEQAGKFFTQSDAVKAEQFRQFAEFVKGIKLGEDLVPCSVEATYEWIAALVNFATTNESVKGHLAPFLSVQEKEEKV